MKNALCSIEKACPPTLNFALLALERVQHRSCSEIICKHASFRKRFVGISVSSRLTQDDSKTGSGEGLMLRNRRNAQLRFKSKSKSDYLALNVTLAACC